ncbi:hypothetical protein EM69_004005 [Salmonella enterica subsp. enterica serovar Typhimurium]|uniref:Uncharacterized protein n=1 Tax=Salmonella phage Stitch TaxID=2991861 RepID=A0A0A0RPH4_9CAUD|nr:hypothetical protein CPT_Stitch59 [Salmonella phage Stitch]AIW04010.1 hypothetical protein CPT_Stitch59 [Salmonella phage Stitch]EDV2866278.1 hypothetical protein [Salmonella enterica subsp. enterica serovar Typhimurium]QCQ65382.1 hypothetical protein CPT_Seabear_072 [Salmonella phage Seabear]
MADFCKECSIDMWGKDTGDLSGLITEAEVKEGYGAVVICEGCGIIRVDNNGKRLEEPDPIATVPVE